MRLRHLAWIPLLVAVSLQDHAQAEAGSEVVVRVGKTEVTAREIEQRLAAMPPFQRKKLGTTPEEVRKNFVNDVIVLEALHHERARELEIEKQPRVRDRISSVLRKTLELTLQEALEKKGGISDLEIEKYYEKNKKRYVTPRRLQLWRILVKDPELAKKIIAEVQGKDGTKRWRALAREHSLDEATKLRGGNLGFVRPDGTTDVPRVKVEETLFLAADKLKDGEVAPNAIKEGSRWAVLWRRGSMRGVTRTLDDERRGIQRILAETRFAEEIKALTEGLQKKHVGEVNYSMLQYVSVDTSGDIGDRPRPGVLPRRPPRKDPTPKKTERGLR